MRSGEVEGWANRIAVEASGMDAPTRWALEKIVKEMRAALAQRDLDLAREERGLWSMVYARKGDEALANLAITRFRKRFGSREDGTKR